MARLDTKSWPNSHIHLSLGWPPLSREFKIIFNPGIVIRHQI